MQTDQLKTPVETEEEEFVDSQFCAAQKFGDAVGSAAKTHKAKTAAAFIVGDAPVSALIPKARKGMQTQLKTTLVV